MSLSIKQAEIAIEAFNNQTQKQLSQLKDHKIRIKKFLQDKDYDSIKKEEIGAVRCIKNIKNILIDLQQLRAKVKESDLEIFDKRVAIKDDALKEIKSFLDMELKPPDKRNGLYHEVPSIDEDFDAVPQIQTYFELNEYQLKSRISLMNEMESLENDFRDLFDCFQQVHVMVHDQAEPVERIANNVVETEIHVSQGTQHLRQALKYKKAAYPLVGALIGTCIAGPIGLLAGMKTGASLMAAGGLASVTGGVLGFSGGKILKNENVVDGSIPEAQHIESR